MSIQRERVRREAYSPFFQSSIVRSQQLAGRLEMGRFKVEGQNVPGPASKVKIGPSKFVVGDGDDLLRILQLIYSLCGLLLGLACIIGGVTLFLCGISGATKWTANFIGGGTELTDAAPGAILFVVGLFIVWVTRFKSHASRLPRITTHLLNDTNQSIVKEPEQ
jgi:hypothetical protein